MFPLFTPQDFERAKSRDLLPIRCTHCGKTFFRTKNEIQGVEREIIKYDCCSKSCAGKHRSTALEVLCDQCGKPTKKIPSEFKKSSHHFCSHHCAAGWQNSHKKYGTRRSKLEKWIQQQLENNHPGWDFHFNRTDAINAELDIYIPALSLAFELNGIFHYEPIYGPQKLASIQSNDHRKMLACAEKGIELCVLDVSSVKYVKPARVQQFLDIIEKIIQTKLSTD